MDNLKNLRSEFGLTQEQLGKNIGVSRSTIAMWETTDTEPSHEVLKKLADHFNVTIDYLLGRTQENTVKGIQIPVLGRVQAGIPIDAIQEILDYEEITPELAATGEFFCLQIKGDSMLPRFAEGDVVIVKQQSDVESGSIAVVLINAHDATIKKLIKTEDGLMLTSTNPAYDPLFYSREDIVKLPVTIVGKVIELRAKFN